MAGGFLFASHYSWQQQSQPATLQAPMLSCSQLVQLCVTAASWPISSSAIVFYLMMNIYNPIILQLQKVYYKLFSTVRRRTVDGWDFATHGAYVGRKLTTMVD